MPILPLLLMSIGGILVFCGVTDRKPVDVVKGIITTGKMPAAHTQTPASENPFNSLLGGMSPGDLFNQLAGSGALNANAPYGNPGAVSATSNLPNTGTRQFSGGDANPSGNLPPEYT